MVSHPIYSYIHTGQNSDTYKYICFILLGTPAELRKESVSLRLSARLVVRRKKSESRRADFPKISYREFVPKSVENTQFWLKWGKNNMNFV